MKSFKSENLSPDVSYYVSFYVSNPNFNIKTRSTWFLKTQLDACVVVVKIKLILLLGIYKLAEVNLHQDKYWTDR